LRLFVLLGNASLLKSAVQNKAKSYIPLGTWLYQ
jgi:hypothetical protein